MINCNIPEYEVKQEKPKIAHFVLLFTENIPRIFRQKENLEILCGYRVNESGIKCTFPYGFFEEDFIYKYLEKNIFGVKEERSNYLAFHDRAEMT